MVKWCDLPYDQSTWEREDGDILGLKNAIDNYEVLKAVTNFGDRKGPGKKKKKKDLPAEVIAKLPPAVPTSDVSIGDTGITDQVCFIAMFCLFKSRCNLYDSLFFNCLLTSNFVHFHFICSPPMIGSDLRR